MNTDCAGFQANIESKSAMTKYMAIRKMNYFISHSTHLTNERYKANASPIAVFQALRLQIIEQDYFEVN